jgi:hypothetical protein
MSDKECWRLLQPDEIIQNGDEYFYYDKVAWVATLDHGLKQQSAYFYRRKIEHPKPLVWSWGKPDKEGLWAFGDDQNEPLTSFVVMELRHVADDREEGWWCYLGPIPTIEQPPKQYREPVLPADYGKVCEFSNDEDFAKFSKADLTLWAKTSETDCAPWGGKGISFFKFARIEKEPSQCKS